MNEVIKPAGSNNSHRRELVVAAAIAFVHAPPSLKADALRILESAVRILDFAQGRQTPPPTPRRKAGR